MGVNRPAISPTLIGRDREIAEISRLLEAARGGRGETVVIAGEAGIGKSRLIAEVAERAGREGMLLLRGSCFEPHRSVPLAPIRDLLQRALASWTSDEARRRLAPVAVDLATFAPEIASLLPPEMAATPASPNRDSHSFLNLLARALLGCARERPLLLIVEDLQWSDDASLEFLGYLARQIADAPFLMLVSYRIDDAHSRLDSVLANFWRERLGIEIRLSGLDESAIGAMVSSIFALPRPPRPSLVWALAELTDGNPFFIEEVLASLVASGDIFTAHGDWERKSFRRFQIPRTISDATERRLSTIDARSLEVLEVAAIIGQRFEFSVLLSLVGQDEPGLAATLKRLIDEHLIVEETDDRFAFRHALMQQAIARRLLARERRALHGRIRDTLLLRFGDRDADVVGRLAYHSFHAGDWAAVMTYGRLAAERARELQAPLAAIDQYDRVFSAAEQLGESAPADLFLHRGQAHEMIGDFAHARADYEAALARAEALDDGASAREALLSLGLLWSGLDTERAFAYIDLALARARELGDPVALAQSLNRMGNWLANDDQPARAIDHHREALAICEAHGSRFDIAETLNMLGMAHSLDGDCFATVHQSARAARLYRELGDQRGLAGLQFMGKTCPGSAYETMTLVGYGTLGDSIVVCEEGVALAREIGWKSTEAFNLALLGECHAAAGQFDEAHRRLRQALDLAEALGHTEWIVQSLWGLGGLHADLFALEDAEQLFARALECAREMHSKIWLNTAAAGLAAVRVRRGDIAGADALFAAWLPETTSKRTMTGRLRWGALVERQLAANEPNAALDLLDELFAAAANLRAESDIPWPALCKAKALARLGRNEEAEQLVTPAIRTARDSGARLMQLRLLSLRAAIHASCDRVEAASVDAQAAGQLLSELAATVPTEQLRDRFVRRMTEELPQLNGAARPQVRALLTPREREVAELVANGKTNRGIADALFISERTVEAHVSNTMRKLGFASRAQIAGWVVSQDSEPNTT